MNIKLLFATCMVSTIVASSCISDPGAQPTASDTATQTTGGVDNSQNNTLTQTQTPTETGSGTETEAPTETPTETQTGGAETETPTETQTGGGTETDVVIDTPSTIKLNESNYLACDNVQIETEHAGYEGTGALNATNETGSGIGWTFNANQSDSNATMQITYANGGDVSRPASISGVMGSVDFAQTTQWNNWTTISVPVSVYAGMNDFEMVALQATGLANIDFIEITSESASLSIPNTLGNCDTVVTNPTETDTSVTPTDTMTDTSGNTETQTDVDLVVGSNKATGFASENGGTTGGQGGQIVYATTGTQIHEALCTRASSDTPIIIQVEGTINHGNTTKVSGDSCNTAADLIELKDISNVTIVGVGNGALFDELGIHIRGSSNIILQNLHIRNVKKSGSPTSNGGDAIGLESGVSNIWADHLTLEASGSETDGYDSLFDMKADSTFVTVSYTIFRNSGRGGLVGSSASDNQNGPVTFHHNWYENMDSRVPLMRGRLGHSYNNFFDGINKSGINVRVGGEMLIENNYFQNATNPVGTFYTNELGYYELVGNIFGDNIVWDDSEDDYNPAGPNPMSTTTGVNIPYSYSVDSANCVPALVSQAAGANKGMLVSAGGSCDVVPGGGNNTNTQTNTSVATDTDTGTDSNTDTNTDTGTTVDYDATGDACYDLVNDPDMNWDESPTLTTDQQIVECLANSLGKPVGFGQNATGGYNPNGSSNLVVIKKNQSTIPEQQIFDAMSSPAYNWVVFDKDDFAQKTDIAMYRLYCTDSEVLSALDNATTAQCMDHRLWCQAKGNDNEACYTEFFNTKLNDSDLPIRNPMIDSNTTFDGRGANAEFLFSGFKIGADSSGASTHQTQNVIITNLRFYGIGHTEDHNLDPDMIRSTGESHDIWIHKNSFYNTGDSAFDVKVGAYDITISFNKLLHVKRAALHGSSDSRTINTQITSTMHNNLFLTETDLYDDGIYATGRRVPLLRFGSTHMFNNVFYNYRKEINSVRKGGKMQFENNVLMINQSLQEKDDINDALDQRRDDMFDLDDGTISATGSKLFFHNDNCTLVTSTERDMAQAVGANGNGSLALQNAYNGNSQSFINTYSLPAGQSLVDYVLITAGHEGEWAFNSPWSVDRVKGADMTCMY
ncbi:hypothetical protein [Marinicellulosiphila megalodicopiae]|uniref:pectate lyase family protein n=1 Tax=Marinicellulosiphila megalodicopiae TaxID=2724896 RepID=UPI003BB17979